MVALSAMSSIDKFTIGAGLGFMAIGGTTLALATDLRPSPGVFTPDELSFAVSGATALLGTLGIAATAIKGGNPLLLGVGSIAALAMASAGSAALTSR